MKFPSKRHRREAEELARHFVSILVRSCGEEISDLQLHQFAEDIVDRIVNDINQGVHLLDDDY